MATDDCIVEPIRFNPDMTSLQLVRQIVRLLKVACSHPPCTFARNFRLLIASALGYELLDRQELELFQAWEDKLEWPVDEVTRWENQ